MSFMRVHILASGSTGNAVYFQLGKTKFLLDAGISARRIEQGLAEVGVRAGDLDGVLITHEHEDYIKGLDVLIRRHEIPVYTRPRTWEGIKCRDRLPAYCCKELPMAFNMGGVRVEAFNISHDAADPVGFVFRYGRQKWVMATDLGCITPEVEQAMKDADVMVLESNHDPQMLSQGPYPPFLKQRIRGKQGHLSNYDAGQLLCRIPWQKPVQVFLAHLSRQNNAPALAEQTVANIISKRGWKPGEDIILHRTYPDMTTSWVSGKTNSYR